jgi:uncharacterized sulfatase
MVLLLCAQAACALPALAGDGALASVARPNILWIVGDDLGTQLGAYGDARARTPTLDRLATDGVRFERAYAASPTCAPSRSALITGRYPTELGTQHQRSRLRNPPRTLLDDLQAAGYTIAWPSDPQAAKTDFNFASPEVTRSRTGWPATIPREPFFAYLNDMVMHEGKLLLSEQGHRELTSMLSDAERQAPERLSPPPYLPDVPEVRRTLARYYELVTAFDHHVASVLERLRAAGVLERTIVVVVGDNGPPLPRAKRSPYQMGLRVPLIVAGPGVDQGVVREDLASLLDLAPTTLALAGVEPSAAMRGRVLLGPARGPEPTFLVATRDRVDEGTDRIRVILDREHLYVRNLMPSQPYAPESAYADRNPAMQALRRAAAEGRLDDVQRLFLAQSKPEEELYDLRSDPFQIRNVAAAPGSRPVRASMRARLRQWIPVHDVYGAIGEDVLLQRGVLTAPGRDTITPSPADPD